MERAELSVHTNMSKLDGIDALVEYRWSAVKKNLTAFAVTDSGTLEDFHYHFALGCNWMHRKEKKQICGIEITTDAGQHINILIKNQDGFRSLYKSLSVLAESSEISDIRISKKTLLENRENLLYGSGDVNGELFSAVLRGESDETLCKIASFYDYLEVQPINTYLPCIADGRAKNKKQIRLAIAKIVEIGRKCGRLVCATSGARYAKRGDGKYRKIMLDAFKIKTAQSDGAYYLRGTKAMLREFSFLDEETAREIVVENTNRVADLIDHYPPSLLTPMSERHRINPITGEEIYAIMPDYVTSPVFNAVSEKWKGGKWKQLIYNKAHAMYGSPLPAEIEKRIESEMWLYQWECYIFIMDEAMQIKQIADRENLAVHVHGDYSASFVAYLLGVSDINPLPAHYRCPKCGKVLFSESEDCGVDLEDKCCPDCGTLFLKDGFNIPHELYFYYNLLDLDDDRVDCKEMLLQMRFSAKGKEKIAQSSEYAGRLVHPSKPIAISFHTGSKNARKQAADKEEQWKIACKLGDVKKKDGYSINTVIIPSNVKTEEVVPMLAPDSFGIPQTMFTEDDFNSCGYEPVGLYVDSAVNMQEEIEKNTHIRFSEIPFNDPETMQLFWEGKTDGVYSFMNKIHHRSFCKMKPKNFTELVKAIAILIGENTWRGNGEWLLEHGIGLNKLISTQDDVVNHLLNRGFCLNDIYATHLKHDLPDKGNAEEWYIRSYRKTNPRHLPKKASFLPRVLEAYRLAYCKVHYPLAFYCAYFNEYLLCETAHTLTSGSAEKRNSVLAEFLESGYTLQIECAKKPQRFVIENEKIVVR